MDLSGFLCILPSTHPSHKESSVVCRSLMPVLSNAPAVDATGPHCFSAHTLLTLALWQQGHSSDTFSLHYSSITKSNLLWCVKITIVNRVILLWCNWMFWSPPATCPSQANTRYCKCSNSKHFSSAVLALCCDLELFFQIPLDVSYFLTVPTALYKELCMLHEFYWSYMQPLIQACLVLLYMHVCM